MRSQGPSTLTFDHQILLRVAEMSHSGWNRPDVRSVTLNFDKPKSHGPGVHVVICIHKFSQSVLKTLHSPEWDGRMVRSTDNLIT